jgi:phosphodiesterase/alkaline phosphatase D-like protein
MAVRVMSKTLRSRRFFLKFLTCGGSAALLLVACGQSGVNTIQPGVTSAFFPQGVWCNDPTDTSVLLGTRILPSNAAASIPVELEISVSPEFASTDILQTHTLTARSAAGSDYRFSPGDYIVRLAVTDLQPDQRYYYRFIAPDGSLSPVGQFLTLPNSSTAGMVRFANISCANLPPYSLSGLARESETLHFVAFNGDTVYADRYWEGGDPTPTLEYYRSLYRQQRDPLYAGDGLPLSMQRTSFVTVWDDHEVIDDYCGQNGEPVTVGGLGGREDISELQGLGYQAFFEYTSIRSSSAVAGVNDQTRLFRNFRCGLDAEIFVTDLRQYRSAKSFGPLVPILPPGITREELLAQIGLEELGEGLVRVIFGSPDRPSQLRERNLTLLGSAQKEWLKSALISSTATYKFIINEVTFSEIYLLPYDRWEGYWQERQEILDFIESNGIQNVVFLTGDIHASLINRINPGRSPAIWEVTTGPVGQDTFANFLRREIEPLGIVNSIEAVYGLWNGLLAPTSEGGIPGVTASSLTFLEIDRPNYTTIEVSGGSVIIRVKDEGGNVITDPRGRRGELILPED